MSRFTNLLVLLTVAGATTLYAQQSKPPVEEAKPKAETNQEKLAAAATSPAAAVDPNAYLLGAEDIIYVRVWKDPDFSGPHVIRPDGKITLQLVGDIQAAGLTPVQMSTVIAGKLADMIKDPKVDVSVTQVNSKRYYIQGEVNRSGPFPLVVPTTVLEALGNCGGFRDFANTKNIVILRKGQRIKFNYKEVVKGKKLEQNIFLEPGDYVIVP